MIKVERNGYVITDTGPNLRVYPGDKVMLLGQDEHLAAARDFLLGDKAEAAQTADAFNGSVLATEVLANVPRAGRTLAELQVARATGVRIVGIQRAGERIINPDGKQTLEAGDNLLVAGTLNELHAFRRWLKGDEAAPPLA